MAVNVRTMTRAALRIAAANGSTAAARELARREARSNWPHPCRGNLYCECDACNTKQAS